LAPTPWLSQTGCGWVICQLEVTPPASTFLARAASRADFGCRLTKIDSWSAMMSASLLLAVVSTVAPLPELD
jgi:hypothetical protein